MDNTFKSNAVAKEILRQKLAQVISHWYHYSPEDVRVIGIDRAASPDITTCTVAVFGQFYTVRVYEDGHCITID